MNIAGRDHPSRLQFDMVKWPAWNVLVNQKNLKHALVNLTIFQNVDISLECSDIYGKFQNALSGEI